MKNIKKVFTMNISELEITDTLMIKKDSLYKVDYLKIY